MSRNTPQRGSKEVLLYANTLDAQFNSQGDYTFAPTNYIVFSEQGSPTQFTVHLQVCITLCPKSAIGVYRNDD